jgi:DNA-binding response OmpR family regulator
MRAVASTLGSLSSRRGGQLSSKILVIDDEQNILKMMELILSGAGYDITTSESGRDGLAKFGSGANFDLVVCDYKMPDLNGIEVEQQMLKIDPSVRVIMVSGYGGIETALDAMNRGATDYLRKPFAPEALRDAVRVALERDTKQAPVNAVCREFSRQGINGFSFELEKEEMDEAFGDITYYFEVQKANDEPRYVKIIFTAIAQELVKAYIDCEKVPCGNRFYEAMAEEKLAKHLREEGSIPTTAQIRIEEISPCDQKWIDSLMTISVA